MPDDEAFLVFVPRPTRGFAESKRGGLWWRRVIGWGAAEAAKEHSGAGAWIKSVDEMKSIRRGDNSQPIRYSRPPIKEQWARRQEREQALADFAAGRDWPPWQEAPS
jgi:hypothetical protein